MSGALPYTAGQWTVAAAGSAALLVLLAWAIATLAELLERILGRGH